MISLCVLCVLIEKNPGSSAPPWIILDDLSTTQRTKAGLAPRTKKMVPMTPEIEDSEEFISL